MPPVNQLPPNVPLDPGKIVEAVKTCDVLRHRLDLVRDNPMTAADGEAIGIVRRAAAFLAMSLAVRNPADINVKFEINLSDLFPPNEPQNEALTPGVLVAAAITSENLVNNHASAERRFLMEEEGEAILKLSLAAGKLLSETPGSNLADIAAKLEYLIRELVDWDACTSPLLMGVLQSALNDCRSLDRDGAEPVAEPPQNEALELRPDLHWHPDIAWSAITWPTVDEVMTGLRLLADLRAQQSDDDDDALAVFRDLADFYLAKAPARSLTEAAQKLKHLEKSGGGFDLFSAPLAGAIFHSVITDMGRLTQGWPYGAKKVSTKGARGRKPVRKGPAHP